MTAGEPRANETPQHLKRVSQIKHAILEGYLPSWERILGSRNRKLRYFDCYAGPGVYEYEGEMIDGSPIIAVRAAKGYLQSRRGHQMDLILVERDDRQRASLEGELERMQPYGQGLQVHVVSEDAKEFIPSVLAELDQVPSFFMVDPYGHPLTIPILNDILRRHQTEVLINFMYYRINMDAGNSKVQHHLDEMFGDDEWRTQPFLEDEGWKRERGFLEYFKSKIAAQYKFHFRIRFDVEDGVPASRTKYYLIHASNHPKAVLLMKDVMWPLGDEEGLFDYSGEEHDGVMFSSTPHKRELRELLLREYSGREVEFDQLREETWSLPFIEKHYRAVVKKLKKEGRVKITPVTSKTDRGLQKKDRIHFLPLKEGGGR